MRWSSPVGKLFCLCRREALLAPKSSASMSLASLVGLIRVVQVWGPLSGEGWRKLEVQWQGGGSADSADSRAVWLVWIPPARTSQHGLFFALPVVQWRTTILTVMCSFLHWSSVCLNKPIKDGHLFFPEQVSICLLMAKSCRKKYKVSCFSIRKQFGEGPCEDTRHSCL